jgi:hypothetical protein
MATQCYLMKRIGILFRVALFRNVNFTVTDWSEAIKMFVKKFKVFAKEQADSGLYEYLDYINFDPCALVQ